MVSLVALLETLPADTRIKFEFVDSDGDAELRVTDGNDSALVFLTLEGIDELLASELPLVHVSHRTNELLYAVRRGVQQHDEAEGAT